MAHNSLEREIPSMLCEMGNLKFSFQMSVFNLSFHVIRAVPLTYFWIAVSDCLIKTTHNHHFSFITINKNIQWFMAFDTRIGHDDGTQFLFEINGEGWNIGNMIFSVFQIFH